MDENPFRIRAERIGADGLDVDEPVTAAWLTETLGESTPFRPASDGRIVVHLERVEDIVHARGRAHLELLADCSRCLEIVEMAIDAPIELALFPREGEPPAANDGELRQEDMGVSTYEEGIVDLASVIRDEVFLELPMSPLCSESCAGLCPSCGTNRNQASCACEQTPREDSPWKALSHIKLD